MPEIIKEDSLDYATQQLFKQYKGCIRKELENFPAFVEKSNKYMYATLLFNQVLTAVSTKSVDERFDVMIKSIPKLKTGLDAFHSYRYIVTIFNNLLKQDSMNEGETL
jgi:hypothetical protein